ncbi:MAG TPA: hypothetical protein ENJ09_04950 [Planctomycetes bacterium]|nr:hypothetical protein [Planctomycetota bacterium]
MTLTIPLQIDRARRRFLIGGEPMVFHCHHYNTHLQRSILDAPWVDSEPFLIGAAADVAFAQLTKVFTEYGAASAPHRKMIAEELYRWCGFGTFDLSMLDEEGGRVTSCNSHYAMAWQAKFGPLPDPVCYFATGWLCGALAAIFDLPLGSFAAEHVSCRAGDVSEYCAWEVRRGVPNYNIYRSPGAGKTTEKQELLEVDEGNVDYEGVYRALTGMDLSGDSEGHIPAFGVYLTRHFANYYARVTFELERALIQRFGDVGTLAAKPLFVESGHVCAFNMFGGIMTSTEWDALILPSLETREDWVHGLVAAVNALGWGRWQVAELSAEAATFVIHDDYESNAYLGMYGTSDHRVSYLAQGAAAGIMNLVYRGEIESKPRFTPDFYEHLFKADGNFHAEQLTCRAMGEKYTTVRVFRG